MRHLFHAMFELFIIKRAKIAIENCKICLFILDGVL